MSRLGLLVVRRDGSAAYHTTELDLTGLEAWARDEIAWNPDVVRVVAYAPGADGRAERLSTTERLTDR